MKFFHKKKPSKAAGELEQGIQLLKATQKRHEEVRHQEKQLAQSLADQTKVLKEVKTSLPETVKGLEKAKKEVKRAQADLKAVCDATSKVSGKVSAEVLNDILKSEFELGQAHARTVGVKSPSPPPVLSVVATAPPPAYVPPIGRTTRDVAPLPTLKVHKGLDCHTITAVYPKLQGSKPTQCFTVHDGRNLIDTPGAGARSDSEEDEMPGTREHNWDWFGDLASERYGPRRRSRSADSPTRHVTFPKEPQRQNKGDNSESADDDIDDINAQLRELTQQIDATRETLRANNKKGVPDVRGKDWSDTTEYLRLPRQTSTPRDRDGCPKPRQRLPRAQLRDAAVNPMLTTPERFQSEKEMLQLMMDPGDMPLLKWMANTMKRIRHGLGNTDTDIILANAMQRKLKMAGRYKQADQLRNFFNTNSGNANWVSVMRSLSLSNPQGLVNNEKVINDFRRNYHWEDEPLPLLNSALKQLEINMDEVIANDMDGLRLFRNLRQRLPEALRLLMRGWDNKTWEEVAEELQLYWNSEFMDEQEVRPAAQETRRTRKTTSPLPPVHIYNVQPAGPMAHSFPTHSGENGRLETPPPATVTPPPVVLPPSPLQPLDIFGNTPPELSRGMPPRQLIRAGQAPPPLRRNPPRIARTNRPPANVIGGNRPARRGQVPRPAPSRSQITRNAPARPNMQPTRFAGPSRPGRGTGTSNRGTRMPSTQDSGVGGDSSQITPSSSQEARDIAESQGERYNFLGNPNIFAPLGLYLDPTRGQSLSVCYYCKAPGHQSRNCVAKFILWLNDKVLARDEELGWIIRGRARPVPPHVKESAERNWKPFLERNNILTIEGLNQYLASQGSPSFTQRTALCEAYFDTRPKNRDRTHWHDRDQWGPHGPATHSSRGNGQVAWAEPQYHDRSRRYDASYWTDTELNQGVELSKNVLGC